MAGIGAVGDDAFGRCLLEQLDKDGVNRQWVRVLRSHSTGVAFVAYKEDGTRSFVFHVAHAAAGQLSPDMLDESLFDGLKCLHVYRV